MFENTHTHTNTHTIIHVHLLPAGGQFPKATVSSSLSLRADGYCLALSLELASLGHCFPCNPTSGLSPSSESFKVEGPVKKKLQPGDLGMILKPAISELWCLGCGRQEGEDPGSVSAHHPITGPWNIFLPEAPTSLAHFPRTLILYSHLLTLISTARKHVKCLH